MSGPEDDRHGRATLTDRGALMLLGALFATAWMLEWAWR